MKRKFKSQTLLTRRSWKLFFFIIMQEMIDEIRIKLPDSLVGVECLVDLDVGLDWGGLKVGDVVFFGKFFCHLLHL